MFLRGELPFRGSIEGSYAGMARFVAAHPNPWGWNPLPYGGLPTQFLYVPLVPYFSAVWIRALPGVAPEMVYRTIVALATCLGPVTLFLFVLRFTESRSGRSRRRSRTPYFRRRTGYSRGGEGPGHRAAAVAACRCSRSTERVRTTRG